MPTESAKTLVQHGFSRTRGDDQWLAALAERQHGAVARCQLLETGWSEEEIEWRQRSGRLHRLHPGAYFVIEGGIPLTTVPRTILDLAATEPLDAVKNLLNVHSYTVTHLTWNQLDDEPAGDRL